MNEAIIHISQGEEAVGGTENIVISTVLGSCISICLWDPDHGVGGMNHLLLPEMQGDGPGIDSTGAIAMERLINRLVKMGAERSRLRAKLFGGSSMLSGLTDIGARNAAFGRNYLAAEHIPCDADSLGGNLARKVRFWPGTGAAKMKFVETAPALGQPIELAMNGVELF